MVVKVVVAVVPLALHMEDLELTLVNLGEEVVQEHGLKDLEEMVALTLVVVVAVDPITTDPIKVAMAELVPSLSDIKSK